jgi:hypothetical protein
MSSPQVPHTVSPRELQPPSSVPRASPAVSDANAVNLGPESEPPHVTTVSAICPSIPAEGCNLAHVTNADFIAAVFPQIPNGASVAVCSKKGDPSKESGWYALRYVPQEDQLPASNNNYLSCSCFFPLDGGTFNARKSQLAAYHCLMLDDLGTKVPLEKLAGFELSWLIETSPGNHQGGIILETPITNTEDAERLLKAVIAAGLCDEGASGLTRWARLPNAINGKEKYRDENGHPFQTRLVQWRLEKRYTPKEILDGLGIEPEILQEREVAGNPCCVADGVLTPKAVENPVVTVLKTRGLYKTPLGSGKHDVTCPWVNEHTDAIDSGTAYFEPGEDYPWGGFKCHHGHCAHRHITDFLDNLDIKTSQAQHKPIIRIVAGEMHRVVNAAERVVASLGKYYQCGGLIVSVLTDATTGDPSIVPINIPTLTRELSIAANWEKYDGRSQDWVPSDPPQRHTSILFDSKSFRYLPPLSGLARQPYLRESDGSLASQPGYDPVSKRFGVFDPKQFSLGEISMEAAKSALALLRDLLREFRFVSPFDEAATLSAMLTAVVRVSLHVAPAFHVQASVFASGKSYLCELIASFAGPGFSEKISYPTTSEEATKVILALLLKNPACVEFDDMDTDWHPHGVIKRMLTSEQISDRILGYPCALLT